VLYNINIEGSKMISTELMWTIVKTGTIAFIGLVLELMVFSSENLKAVKGFAILIIVCACTWASFLVLPNHALTPPTHAVAYVQHKSQPHNRGGE